MAEELQTHNSAGGQPHSRHATQIYSKTTPIGFLNTAEAYRSGAQLLARDLKGGWASQPTRYLYYHAIELYLKAALINSGYTETQLRNLRHGFGQLASLANLNGLGLTESDDLAVLAIIDSDGNYIKARYHHTGYFRVATIQALDSTAFELAFLLVEMLRRSGLAVRQVKPQLPTDFRYQIS